MTTPQEAIQRLKDGNQRFVANSDDRNLLTTTVRPSDLAKEQKPFAIILGCSDSRVPAEIVFDQTLGELFVIRVAGNIVAPSQIGSIEFAAECFGTQLVVVMGHSNCGAVAATANELQLPSESQSPNLLSIVKRIGPAMAPLVEKGLSNEELIRQGVKANIKASVQNLGDGSEILRQLVQDGKLEIVGAEYSLDTGTVTFFDEA